MSISLPLQADQDGHHIILKVRTGLATTLLLDDPTILLFYFYYITLYTISFRT